MFVFRPGCQLVARGHTGAQGFTLIELMVTVAVITIVSAIAVPSMQWMINANRLSGQASELSSAFQLARSEAIRRAAPVTICASTDGSTCANSTDWTRIVIRGRDNAASAGGTEQIDVIRDVSLPNGVQLSGPAAGIVFNPSGLSRSEQTVTVCIPTTKPTQNRRVITVMISGAARTSKTSGGGSC